MRMVDFEWRDIVMGDDYTGTHPRHAIQTNGEFVR